MTVPTVSATPTGDVLLELVLPGTPNPVPLVLAIEEADELRARLDDAVLDAHAVVAEDDEPDRDDPSWFDVIAAEQATAEDARGVTPGSLS